MRPSRTTRAPAFVSTSDALKTDYHIHVEQIGGDAEKVPMVAVLDGDYFFEHAVEAARGLHTAGSLQPLLVAGLGYGRPFGDPGNRRGRDYTPSRSSEEPDSGGARDFLEFLTSSLLPELERRYAVDREISALAGHSLSGLFVLYALFQETPIMRRAIVGAPSIWWDDRHLLKHVAAYRDAHAALPAEVFLGMGEDETPSMLHDLDRLQAQLRERPFSDLEITTGHFPGRTHYDLTPDLFRAGLRALYGRKRGPAIRE